MSDESFLGMFRRADWMERGACHALVETVGQPERDRIFFPTQGESTKRAKAICADCSVVDECLEYALTTPERYGIWGGTSERERRIMRRERGVTVGGPRRPIPHGTTNGYGRCVKRPEGACDACRDANNRFKNPDGRRPGEHKTEQAS